MNSNLSSDLDYIRDLAESGAHAPLLGGRFLAWWGAMVTIAYLLHSCALNSLFGLSMASINYVWLGFLVVSVGGFFALLALFPRDKPGSGSAGNRVDQVIWMYGGFSIFAFFAGMVLSAFVGDGKPAIHPDASLPLIFAVYMLGLMVTGTLAANVVLKAAGWVALVMVGVSVLLQGSDTLYLAGAAGAFLTVFVPGIVLLLREPRSVV